ncbi:DUF4124 domain-containing protein [Marinobacter salicampi]|uniref:DUF4124 domain-containing protein n=1 Tax=Marinobacter salicampi TaxID=435907 RepID=UPI00140A6AFA|nr:DUF4124 domain-containing protein [Marinobacter salicampi]
MSIKILVMATVVILAPALASSASVYKWTDDEGVTHFGDRQPTGRETESVKLRSGTSSKLKQPPSAQEQLESLTASQQEGQQREAETAQEEARRKQRTANCETARSNLNVLDSNARIKVEENGEQRYLGPEEIAEQSVRFQEIADANC